MNQNTLNTRSLPVPLLLRNIVGTAHKSKIPLWCHLWDGRFILTKFCTARQWSGRSNIFSRVRRGAMWHTTNDMIGYQWQFGPILFIFMQFLATIMPNANTLGSPWDTPDQPPVIDQTWILPLEMGPHFAGNTVPNTLIAPPPPRPSPSRST